MKRFLAITILILCATRIFAQEIIADDVKTARIRVADSDFSYPICVLGQTLKLEFDILNDNYSDLHYSIQHCDCNFDPDDLSFGEFAEGFNDRTVDNFENSFNTFQNFTHYTITIPNNDITLTISGNYIINIYESDDPEKIILSKRFMICEESDNSKISATIQQPFISDYAFNYQQIKVNFNNDRLRINNPGKYLKIFVMQNGDFSTRKELEISGFMNNEIQYQKNNGNNIFHGGSEYRHFDSKNVNFKALGIDDIKYDKGCYNYILTPYAPVSVSYTSYEDLNGRYYIKNDKGYNNELEADYINVLFRLKYNPFADCKVYLCGELTNYQYNENSEMKFNSESGLWEKQLTLKQGLYNFQYVVKDNNGNTIDYPAGSWYNTENDYFIAVYTTLLQNRGDRLLMYKVINSVK